MIFNSALYRLSGGDMDIDYNQKFAAERDKQEVLDVAFVLLKRHQRRANDIPTVEVAEAMIRQAEAFLGCSGGNESEAEWLIHRWQTII